MKAIGARQFLPVNNPECLLEFDAEMPVPKPMDLLVKVHAIALNPVDTKIRKSLGAEPLEIPRILGYDAAGTVEAVGPEVTGFAVGDEVFYAGDLTRSGCNSEFQTVDARLVAKKPASWSFAEAAALPLVAITAWELLFERMVVEQNSGKAILVINGAGGLGSALIPLARSAGLKVVATASRPDTIEWCKSLGADHVINHREPLRPQAEALGISEFPYIANLFDTETYWDVTADLLAPSGAIGLVTDAVNPLHIGGALRLKSPRIAWEYMPGRSRFQTADMHVQGEILVEIARRCDAGEFPSITTRHFDQISAANLREAHAAMENGTAHGKWVLTGW